MSFIGAGGPAAGMGPRNVTVQLTAHAAISKGDVVAVSPLVNSDEQFYTTQLPASGNASIDDNEFGIFAVATETVASGAKGMFLLSGIVTAATDGTTNDIAVGNGLEVDPTAANLNFATTVGSKVVAFALEARTTDSVGLVKVMFDGYNGFGVVNA